MTMPVEGFPDKDHHRFCFKCRKWFDPDEGREMAPTRIRPPGFEFARELSGYTRSDQFICESCFQSRRKFRFTLTAIAIVIALLAFAFWWPH